MSTHRPLDPNFETRVRESFSRQRVMQTLGVAMTKIEPGIVELTLPFRADLTQQHGFIHAGIVATVLDSACGYAAFSLMPANASVLTVEYKINLVAPAKGERLITHAEVKRAGRTITVCHADGFMVEGSDRRLTATMLGTIMCLPDKSDS